MTSKDRYLVVVSILEGRKFPKRPKYKLITEARFDGVLLATDPVDHTETPSITQEVAWELDKKSLQQHRLQRASIKVQCYAADLQSSMKEPIGYIVLDLRSAQKKQTSKWYLLLHGKYHKTKPEIRVGIYIDEEPSAVEQKATLVPARSEMEAKDIKPVLNEDEGFYQLGPEDKCTDHFILSITIAFAANLPHLIPASQPLPANADGYFFYYSLFTNDVTNEPFHNLLNPDFPAERASVKLRTSIEVLLLFLDKQPPLQVHLCVGDQSLGCAELSLGEIFRQDPHQVYMRPLTLDGSFQLIAPKKTQQQLPAVPEDQRPVVGISAVLRTETQSAVIEEPPLPEAGTLPTAQAGTLPITSMIPKAQYQVNSPPTKLQKTSHKEKQHARPAIQEDRRSSPSQNGEFSEKTEDAVSSLRDDVGQGHDQVQLAAVRESEKQTTHKISAMRDHQRSGKPEPVHLTELQHQQPPDTPSISLSQPHIEIPNQAHHLSVSIDLRTIHNFQLSTIANVFLRYTYPFFGSAAPVMTHPTVEARKGTEVLIPNSCCTFDFAATLQQLSDNFVRVPLVVEIWDRQREITHDTLLGVTRVPLANVLSAEQTKLMNEDGSLITKQVFIDHVSFISINRPNMRLGQLQYIVSLEDLGPVNTQHISVPHNHSQTQSSEVSRSEGHDRKQEQERPDYDARDTAEYKAALELELWKEKQEYMYETQMKEKEGNHLKNLADEWKKRDKDREFLVKKKLAEYGQLEEQLRKTIVDLDCRERQLRSNEDEVSRLKTDLEREHEAKLIRMQEASRRMQEDCEHQVKMEKIKLESLEETVLKLKTELSEAERKYQSLDKDFSAFRDQQHSKPEIRLQSEINLLTLEKVELERKLESCNKSKNHYKQQWGRALKELARLKEKEQSEAKRHFRKQQQELEHMRLRYLAAEEKDVVKAEKQELEELKNQINKLYEMEAQKQSQHTEVDETNREGRPRDSLQPLQSDMDSTIDDHITRLIEERDALLRTGVYKTEDRIIAELDRQIRQAIESRDR